MPSSKSKKNQHKQKHNKSQKNRRFIRGGDAYNSIPARYITPLPEHQMALPENGRFSIGGGGSKHYRRRYLKKHSYSKKQISGGAAPYTTSFMSSPTQPIAEKYTSGNRFLV